MLFNYDKLNGRITEICKTRKEFAKRLSISMNSLTSKLDNRTPFKQEEIIKSMEILDILPEELTQYFFNLKVEKN